MKRRPPMPRLPEHVTAKSYALCQGCGELFSSVSSFDRHQIEGYGKDGYQVRCAPPAQRGLVADPGRHGAWSTGTTKGRPPPPRRDRP